MSGICLTEDTNVQIALYGLISSNFNSLLDLNRLNESIIGKSLITGEAYKFIEVAINKGNPNDVVMLRGQNKAKLNELALIKLNMWDNYKLLKVHILPHSFNKDLNSTIESHASEWSPHCGIDFKFVKDKKADIIIELNGNGISSSIIGKNSLNLSKNGQVTMRLGIGIETRKEFIRRAVLHEFGHALGCVHEHQSIGNNIEWNEQAVYNTFTLGGWDKPTIKKNVLDKFTNSEITNSKFDRDSIMIYPISRDLTTNGFEVGWNLELSDQDKAFMKKAYSLI